MLLTFNLSSAAMVKDVAPYIRSEEMRAMAAAIFVTLAVLQLVGWYWAVSVVETQVHTAIHRGVAPQHLPYFLILPAWSLVVIFTGMEILVFLFR